MSASKDRLRMRKPIELYGLLSRVLQCPWSLAVAPERCWSTGLGVAHLHASPARGRIAGSMKLGLRVGC